MEGVGDFFFFWGGQSEKRRGNTKECLGVFGDDTGIGSRHMETADWKIMGNGGI